MNYRRMEVLLAIDKFNNISKAAEYLNIKQPTVYFHMKNLEDELKVTLFYSHSGRIFLTKSGKALLIYAKKILNLSEDAIKTIKGLNSPKDYTITIGSSSVPSIYILPKIISKFKKLHPYLSVKITVMPAPDIQRLIKDYKISLGIISSNDLLLNDLNHLKLCTDEMVLVFSKDHHFCKKKQITKEMLIKEHFILHTNNSTTRLLTNEWLKDLGIKIKPYLEISSSEAIKKAVIYNIGVSILSKISIQEEINNGQLHFSYLPNYSPSRNIYVVYNKDRYISPMLQNLIDLLKNWHYELNS